MRKALFDKPSVHRSHIVAFIAILAIAVIAMLLNASYFFEGSDVYIKNAVSGTLTGGIPANMPHTFEEQIGLSYLYKALYDLAPNIPWYDLAMTAFASLSIFLGLLLLRDRDKGTAVWRQLVFMLLFLRVLTLMQLTVIGFLLSFFSLVAFSETPVADRWKRSAYLLIFLLGGMIRIDSILMALTIFAIYDILMKRRFNYRAYIPAVLIVGLLMAVVNIPMSEEAAYFKDIRPYQYALWDFNSNITELDGDDPECLRAIDELTSVSFLSDNHYLTPGYFKKIGLVTKDKFNVLYWNNFFQSTTIRSKADDLLEFFWSNGFLTWSVILSLFFIVFYSKRSIYYVLILLVLFFTVALVLKIESHIFMVFCLAILFELIRSADIGHEMAKVTLAGILILSSVQLIQDTELKRAAFDFYSQNISKGSRFISMDVTLMDKINSRVMVNQHYPENITFDNGLVYMMDELENFCQREGVTNSYEGNIDYLTGSGIVLYSADSLRLYLHQAYFGSCYRREPFEIEVLDAQMCDVGGLFSYRIH